MSMKILYVTTISNTINAFLIPYIKELIMEGHHVDIACNQERSINEELINLGCRFFQVEFNRSPLNIDNFTAYRQVKKILHKENYDVIHVHTPVASIITRLAYKKKNTTKILYTSHGFHFYKGAPLKNWLIYYPIEKLLSKRTDCIITINKEDYNTAKSQLDAKKTSYIPGIGLDIKKYVKNNVDANELKRELNIPNNAFVVLSVGELNDNKNHETIIRAISRLKNPNIYYILCGQGKLEQYLLNVAQDVNISESIRFLGFRTDLPDIYKVADVFAFPSKREGLGMASLEAMSNGLPIVTSNVHGILDYSIYGKTGFNYRPNDVVGFSEGILKLYTNKKISKQMGMFNQKYVLKFDIANSLSMQKVIYEELGIY